MELIFIGGNHDNWTELEKLPVGSDGLAPLHSNIKYLPRPGRTTLHGLVIGGLGGAFSVDCQYRTEGKDWWVNEEPTVGHLQQLMQAGPIDVLLAHDVPSGVPLKPGLALNDELGSRANRTRELVAEAVRALQPRAVFCGHWHQRTSNHIEHDSGAITRIEVLDMDGSVLGNTVLLSHKGGVSSVEPLKVQPS